MNRIDYKWVIIGVLFIVTLFSVQSCYNNMHKVNEQTGLVKSMNDTLFRWKDEKGNKHVGKQTIQTADPKTFLEIKFKDKEIQELQAIVKQYKKDLGKQGSVTHVKGETVIDTFYAKPAKFAKSAIWIDSIHNKWIVWDYKVDSTKVNFKLKLNHEYAIINKEKSNGWFKKPTPYSEVVNYNPYSSTISTTTYRVTNDVKSKHLKVGGYVGYGATLIGNDVKAGPQVGGGITYNF